MYFLKQLSIAVALGFALVDARAVNLNGNNEITARDVTAARKAPRGVGASAGGKLAGRGVNLAKREDPDVDKDAAKANAQACADSLNKLRRKIRRRALKAKRADDDDDDEDMDDDDDAHDDLGNDSYTVGMGQHDFVSEGTAHDEGFELIGTVGINSCSGVLIVGENGYTIAHLNPIEENQDGTPRQDSAAEFHDAVVSMVEGDYNSNKENMGSAAMYVLTPNGDKGEAAELDACAKRLEIPISHTTYDVLPEDQLNDDWFDQQRGTIFLDRSDTNNKKVKANGDPAPAPAPAA